MGWSKSTRISVMLAIDIAFFSLELGVGIYVGSLALLADAFHMLNDIISLLVGLWAVMVARKATSDKYTYGWLRAEILGAFFNAVFLIALCVSILLEAITRFIDPPEIKNPKLILVVGALGLTSNLVGFLVLGGHDHSHEHGDHDHPHPHGDHSHENQLSAVEEGYGTLGSAADDSGPARDVLPEVAIARVTNQAPARRIRFSHSDVASDSVAFDHSDSRLSGQSRNHSRSRLRSSSNRHNRLQSIDDMSIYPASFRQEIIAASRNQQESSSGSSSDESAVDDDETPEQTENSPLLSKDDALLRPNGTKARAASRVSHRESTLHESHHHKKAKKAKKAGHGHDHGDMGMNAMVLHVLGDALGNVGVIVTALIIWLTDLKEKYYADPAVSVFITLIILRSALPLTFATSKILLQATPDHLHVSEIREDIESLPGVVSCHHVHIWQLSDTQLVASMHIHVEFPISEAGGDKYMELARRVRNCLHEYGIHSATIQPEFCTDDHHLPHNGGSDSVSPAVAPQEQPPISQQQTRGCATGNDLCLLECIDNCAMQGCCRSATITEGSVGSGHSEHGHDHDYQGHDH